jgi:hypothetical protein
MYWSLFFVFFVLCRLDLFCTILFFFLYRRIIIFVDLLSSRQSYTLCAQLKSENNDLNYPVGLER